MYDTVEERIKALRASRNKYQKNKEWYCDICLNGKNYTARGKFMHLKAKKHIKKAKELESKERDTKEIDTKEIDSNKFFL